MMETRNKQAIIISGESGAGKTEGAKLSMKFLTTLSSSGGVGGSKISIEVKILKCNPILESFGNSKTIRYNNSSRFGKYVKLIFDGDTGNIMGARTLNYLLEKSRVVRQSPDERNYHVFFHLMKGGDTALQSRLGLMNEEGEVSYTHWNYLKGGVDVPPEIINDAALYRELAEQFDDLGFTEGEQIAVWNIVAACLHLGNLEFDESVYREGEAPCGIKNPIALREAARLLEIDHELLFLELAHKGKMKLVTQRTPVAAVQCYANTDALSKQLYDNLFSWLVKRMNKTILPAH